MMSQTIAFDTETFLIEPGILAPKLVCVSYVTRNGIGDETRGVLHAKDALGWVTQMLEGDALIVGHNVPFDLAVLVSRWPQLLRLVFAAYENNRVVDTMTRQKLIDIGEGIEVPPGYSLQKLCERHAFPQELDKDTWRLRYGELYDVPLDEWPRGAYDYAQTDAEATMFVYLAQEKMRYRTAGNVRMDFLGDQHNQARAHWALHLMSCHGIKTDEKMIARLEEITLGILSDHEELLIDEGLARRDKHGKVSRNTKAAAAYADALWETFGGYKPTTKGGKTSLSEDSCKRLNDPLMTAYQEYGSARTLLSRIEELKAGIDTPIQTRFDELKDTGRTGSSNPNIQNRPVKHREWNGKIAGDRECFIPREGKIFYIADVPGLELRTMAQSCLARVGQSEMAKVLNEGRDPHLEVAASLLKISKDEAYARKKNIESDSELYLARQVGKIVNFGLLGRLGPDRLVEQARAKYGLSMTRAEATSAIEAFHMTWPEFTKYFEGVDDACRGGDLGRACHVFSERWRGLIKRTEMSNTFAQGLGADATKAALWALAKEQYTNGGSWLYRCRTVNFIHDEYIVEGPEDDRIHERADEMARVICDAANVWLPDVPIPLEEMKPIACRRWSKKAKRIFDSHGRLAVWDWEHA